MELLPPRSVDHHWLAQDRVGRVEVRFAGRGPWADRARLLESVGGEGLEPAWCRQVHSDRVVPANAGECGEADALVTSRAGLALTVVTADCVPLVIAGRDRLAAVHAGWRGIAARIVTRTLERLGDTGPLTAWLGPAIGSCCYEVGNDVAERVVAVSGPTARVDPEGSQKPHLDLHRAVALQLEGRVAELRRIEACTRCHPQALSSYRRDGARAGRNFTFAWLRA